jgi:hypothetical protein
LPREPEGVEVLPSARRLIKSLRDMGYEFSSAVSDLVDNSIEAGATQVSVQVEFEGDNSWVSIADNGRGMSPSDLREAMRYGSSSRDYGEEDLGKFGLGMKVASLSQCQSLAVASRTSRERADIAAYAWDLEHIERVNRWEILDLRENGVVPDIMKDPLRDKPGTVVVWRRLDRLLGYAHPYGEHARKRLSLMCRETENYLAMVFHRFLQGEAKGRRKLKIVLNDNVVEPWDPFCRSEPHTKTIRPIPIKVEHEGVTGYVVLEPYILPNQSGFSSVEAFRLASGPANWNQQQGFYIYRSDRLIQSGGWNRLRTADEHTKLARIGVKFSPQLDEAFKVNVTKMRVSLPPQARDQIETAIKPVIKLAQQAYRPAPGGGGASAGGDGTQTSSDRNNSSSSSAPSESAEQRARRGATWAQLIRALLAVADPSERAVIKRVAARLGKHETETG